MLLGMAWISKAKNRVKTERKVLIMKGNKYNYSQLNITAHLTSSDLVTIYASETSHITAWGKEKWQSDHLAREVLEYKLKLRN